MLKTSSRPTSESISSLDGIVATQPTPPPSPLPETVGPGRLPVAAPRWVELHDGSLVNLTGWSAEALLRLQVEQEPLFAKAILATAKGSLERPEITAKAYATVCTILEELGEAKSSPVQWKQLNRPNATVFSMGMDPRYSDFVLRLLDQQNRLGLSGRFFEVGFSAGSLLKRVAEAGYDVAGLEVVESLREQACRHLPVSQQSQLYVGDFLKTDFCELSGNCSLVYWNDVFEHVHPDEIKDYLNVIFQLLAPGGLLVTITPNWHMRPSDVTIDFCPPRSEPIGFHLKEYTLREQHQLLSEAGFCDIATPSFISMKKFYFAPQMHLTPLKLWLEPFLERLPYRAAVQFCRRFGLSCTIARKGST
jgi:SAM-dependent methyltransferase